MTLDTLVENYEDFARAQEAVKQGPQAETSYITSIAARAPGADPATINQFGYLAQDDARRQDLMKRISGNAESHVYTSLGDNLPEVLGELGEQESISLGISYSDDASGVRNMMKILKDKNVNSAYHDIVLKTTKGASESEQRNAGIYNEIINGFNSEAVMKAFESKTIRAQKEYVEGHFYAKDDKNPIFRYSADKSASYLTEVFQDEAKLKDGGMQIAGLYYQALHPQPESQ
jgi:hypothetical protein